MHAYRRIACLFLPALLAVLRPEAGASVVHETFNQPLDAALWTVDASASVVHGVINLPAGKSLKLREITTHGAIAIHVRCKLLETGPDPYLAVHFGTPADKEVFRALGYLKLLAGCDVVLRLSPRGRRITYDCDGAFYGERVLAPEHFAKLFAKR